MEEFNKVEENYKREYIVPIGYKKIGKMAFANLNTLRKVVIPSSVEQIGELAFFSCSKLEHIVLPRSLKVIEGSAFYHCESLEEITLPDNIQTIEPQTFDGCISLTKITLPKNLKKIGTLAFCDTLLRQVELPESLTSIWDGAFCSCSELQEIRIPSKVDYLGEDTFFSCSGLKQVELSDAISEIGDRCFSGCSSMQQISLPKSLKIIGTEAFDHCGGLKSIELPSDVKTILNRAFAKSGLESVNLPENLEKMGKGVFKDCVNLKSVKLGKKLNEIPQDSFIGCSSLSEITIPSNIKTIGVGAFFACGHLTKVNLEEGSEKISEEAFSGCSKLKEINIPSSVKFIGAGAFLFCDSLTKITLGQNVDLKSSLPFNPAYITLENGRFVITKQKREGAYKCTENNVGNVLALWREKEELFKLVLNKQTKLLINELYQFLPKEKFMEFYKTKNLKFYKRLYETCLKKVNKNQMSYVLRFLYCLGAFEPKQMVEVKTKSGSKKVEVFPAQKTSEYFINCNFNFNSINAYELFEKLQPLGYKHGFTEFLLQGPNFFDMLRASSTLENFFARCYNEFEAVQKTNSSNAGGQRQLKPTVKKFVDYFKTSKFTGVTEKIKPVAVAISPYFSSQETFESAVSVLEEFEAENVPETLIENLTLKSINEYSAQIKELAGEIISTLSHKTGEEFVFEWLKKNDPTNLILGKCCNCCAHLEGQGVGIMRASIVDPFVQNMVIKTASGEIVAKSTLYINPEKGYGIFNTVGVAEEYLSKSNSIYEQFKKGAKHFVNEFNKNHPSTPIKILTVGMGSNKLERHIKKHDKKSFIIYSDPNYAKYGIEGKRYRGDSADSQYIIWEESESVK